MRKKLLLVLVLLIALACTGCSLKTREKRPTIAEEVTVTEEDMETFKKVSEAIFDVEKEELKIDDLTPAEKGELAIKVYEDGGYYTMATGKAFKKNFEKYFGTGHEIEFEDIPCFIDHGSKEENIMLYFDENQDKYVYNEAHPGHGGGGNPFIGSRMTFDSLGIIGDEYHYTTRVLFYGTAMCHDIGPCDYGKAYKSYIDAKNEINPLVEIDNNEKYVDNDPMAQFPTVDIDQVVEDYKEKLETYEFVFVREGNNLIFKEYFK